MYYMNINRLIIDIISILFEGICNQFERYVARSAYPVYYNLILFDNIYIKQQTIIELNKLKLNIFTDKNNGNKHKEWFINSFWNQRNDKVKFEANLNNLHLVCHNDAEPNALACFMSPN